MTSLFVFATASMGNIANHMNNEWNSQADAWPTKLGRNDAIQSRQAGTCPTFDRVVPAEAAKRPEPRGSRGHCGNRDLRVCGPAPGNANCPNEAATGGPNCCLGTWPGDTNRNALAAVPGGETPGAGSFVRTSVVSVNGAAANGTALTTCKTSKVVNTTRCANRRRQRRREDCRSVTFRVTRGWCVFITSRRSGKAGRLPPAPLATSRQHRFPRSNEESEGPR